MSEFSQQYSTDTSLLDTNYQLVNFRATTLRLFSHLFSLLFNFVLQIILLEHTREKQKNILKNRYLYFILNRDFCFRSRDLIPFQLKGATSLPNISLRLKKAKIDEKSYVIALGWTWEVKVLTFIDFGYIEIFKFKFECHTKLILIKKMTKNLQKSFNFYNY